MRTSITRGRGNRQKKKEFFDVWRNNNPRSWPTKKPEYKYVNIHTGLAYDINEHYPIKHYVDEDKKNAKQRNEILEQDDPFKLNEEDLNKEPQFVLENDERLWREQLVDDGNGGFEYVPTQAGYDNYEEYKWWHNAYFVTVKRFYDMAEQGKLRSAVDTYESYPHYLDKDLKDPSKLNENLLTLDDLTELQKRRYWRPTVGPGEPRHYMNPTASFTSKNTRGIGGRKRKSKHKRTRRKK